MLGFDVEELVLEYANREMSEVDVLRDIADAGRDVAVGVVDVKNSHVETADEVARGSKLVLGAGVPADAADARPRLRLQPDRPLASRREDARARRRPRPGPRRGRDPRTVTQEVAR